MKVSKKAGIALFVTTAVIMAVLIVFHKNPGTCGGSGTGTGQEDHFLRSDRGGMRCILFTGMTNSPDCRWN